MEASIPLFRERAAPAGDKLPSSIIRDPWAVAALVAGFAYAALTIDRGWIPHDEGLLGQAAVRVLTGELPHRDFAIHPWAKDCLDVAARSSSFGGMISPGNPYLRRMAGS